MPTTKHLFIVCSVAVAVSVSSVLLLHFIGIDDQSAIVAAIVGSVSASVASSQLSATPQPKED